MTNDLPILFDANTATAGYCLRMAMQAKDIAYTRTLIPYDDDEALFATGFAELPAMKWPDGTTDNRILSLLEALDQKYPALPLLPTKEHAAEWQAFLQWRQRILPLTKRLIAPVLPIFPDIGGTPENLDRYRKECESRYGMGPEALSNDRYTAYNQLENLGQLKKLSQILAKKRYYLGEFSVIDALLTADLHLLRLLDGVSIPLDLIYYFSRVAEHCKVDLDEETAPK